MALVSASQCLHARLPPRYTLPSEATLERGNDKEWCEYNKEETQILRLRAE
ncbi:MAG: hypothetical protein LBO72_03655 [Helicobacteraceae bacterium]|nr:hypothetical protein [Helicobacteraceae bacterium]